MPDLSSNSLNGKNSSRPLILDGAMGTYLQSKNIAPDRLWFSGYSLNKPELIELVHKEYIQKGANIITTNTFRSNPAAVKKSGYAISSEHLVEQSLLIAKRAVENTDVRIAGSNPPAEDSYQKARTLSLKELEENHKQHIELLTAYGADFILNETQSHLDEIKIISEYCASNSIPFVISLFVDHNLNLLSGERVEEAIRLVLDYTPVAVSFNCIKPSLMKDLLERVEINFNNGFYFNCGLSDYTEEVISTVIEPDNYARQVAGFIGGKTIFVGSCCGSTPEHTKSIKEHLDEIYRN